MKGKKKMRRWLKKTLTTPAFWLGVGVTVACMVVLVLMTKFFVVLPCALGVGLLLCVVLAAVLWYLRRKKRQQIAIEGGQS